MPQVNKLWRTATSVWLFQLDIAISFGSQCGHWRHVNTRCLFNQVKLYLHSILIPYLFNARCKESLSDYAVSSHLPFLWFIYVLFVTCVISDTFPLALFVFIYCCYNLMYPWVSLIYSLIRKTALSLTLKSLRTSCTFSLLIGQRCRDIFEGFSPSTTYQDGFSVFLIPACHIWANYQPCSPERLTQLFLISIEQTSNIPIRVEHSQPANMLRS